MKPIAVLAVAALLSAAPLASHAQAAPSALPDWDHLTPAQRELLVAPLRDRWNADPAVRPGMLRHAERWRTLTPEQRLKARRGMQRFQRMAPAEREQARAAFDRFRQLPPEERKAMREKLRAMTPEQRRAWLQAQAAGQR